MADASVLSCAYEAVHRLTDASGTLASTVTRAYDAFNRLQVQSGASH